MDARVCGGHGFENHRFEIHGFFEVNTLNYGFGTRRFIEDTL